MELYKKAIYVAGEMADETYLDVLIVCQVWSVEVILKISESG